MCVHIAEGRKQKRRKGEKRRGEIENGGRELHRRVGPCAPLAQRRNKTVEKRAKTVDFPVVFGNISFGNNRETHLCCCLIVSGGTESKQSRCVVVVGGHLSPDLFVPRRVERHRCRH